MTKLACSFTGHLDLCDPKDGAFPNPGPAPHSLKHSQGALMVAQTQKPQGRGSDEHCPVSIHPIDRELESDKNHQY